MIKHIYSRIKKQDISYHCIIQKITLILNYIVIQKMDQNTSHAQQPQASIKKIDQEKGKKSKK